MNGIIWFMITSNAWLFKSRVLNTYAATEPVFEICLLLPCPRTLAKRTRACQCTFFTTQLRVELKFVSNKDELVYFSRKYDKFHYLILIIFSQKIFSKNSINALASF